MDKPDLSAACFTGRHADCRLRRCGCVCHTPEDIHQEPPGRYPAAWAFQGEEQPMADKCRSCGAEIRFVPSAANGALIPLDAAPVPSGNIVIRDGKAVVIHFGLWGQEGSDVRYVSHFSTCPNATKHRRKKS